MLIIISDESRSTGQTGRSQEQVTHQDIYLHCSPFSPCLSLVEKVEEPKIVLTFQPAYTNLRGSEYLQDDYVKIAMQLKSPLLFIILYNELYEKIYL